jgi:hypothetical protein
MRMGGKGIGRLTSLLRMRTRGWEGIEQYVEYEMHEVTEVGKGFIACTLFLLLHYRSPGLCVVQVAT